MSSTRKETTWCTLCGARFTHAEIDGYACCPKCGDTSLPCDTNDDVSVVVNWHELRILGIWAENWAHACQTRNPGGSKEARPEVIHAITRRLQRQYPENTALTLSGEIMQIKDGGLDIEGSGIAKNSVLPVNGPGAAPPSEAPLTDAERDEALATGHADLLIDVGPCGMAYRELVAQAERAEDAFLEYGRHSEGCNAPFGLSFSCKCGFDDTCATIRALQPPAETERKP